MSDATKSKKGKRKPLTVWELPKLLQPVHDCRKSTTKGAKERPHFPQILAFVYRNRFAVSAQIRRRFPEHLPSDRTARRHLAELEDLGLLDTVQPPSPLWPKTYYCTSRGVRRLRKAYANKGTEWRPTVIDRYRREAFSPAHVTHELFITEIGLEAWECARRDSEIEMVTIKRRALSRHPAFAITMAGQWTRLIPDGMFLVRQEGKGMIASFIEMDMSTMSERQWSAKLSRYEVWSQSEAGNRWLTDLYAKHGASSPRPVFRILVVGNNQKRKSQLVNWSRDRLRFLKNRVWFTSVPDIVSSPRHVIPLAIDLPHHTIL